MRFPTFSCSPDLRKLRCAISNDKPLLLRHPSISRTHIVFSFANDLSGALAAKVARQCD